MGESPPLISSGDTITGMFQKIKVSRVSKNFCFFRKKEKADGTGVSAAYLIYTII